MILAYGGLLSQRTDRAVSGPEFEWVLSTASLAELAIKNAIGKLDLPEAEVQRAMRDLQIVVLPFEANHAFEMFSLPLHHRDPFDRMILATAIAEKLPIVTGDRIFRRYAGVKIIW